MLVVIGSEVIKGDRPEEEVAMTFLEALYDGRGDEVYDLTTPGYQAIVFREDLAALSRMLASTAGATTIEVLGSERTPGTDPQDSYVGYQGGSDIGTVEGVMVLVQLRDGAWSVRDVSYRFPDATPDQVAELFALTEMLNQQFVSRAQQGAGGSAPSDQPS
jgi:hypothetical protein